MMGPKIAIQKMVILYATSANQIIYSVWDQVKVRYRHFCSLKKLIVVLFDSTLSEN